MDKTISSTESLSAKDLNYLRKLEDENDSLKRELEGYQHKFDWSVLWQDEEPSKLNLMGVVNIALLVLIVILMFVFKH